jgi:hypothetical protein
LFLRGPRSDQIADDYEPRSKTDADSQQLGCFKPAHSLDHSDAGAHSAFWIVLMRNRVAEIGEYAVAHVRGHEPIVSANGLGDALVVRADRLTKVLGIEPRR